MAETVILGEFVPDWLLVRATRDGGRLKAGQFALLRCNDPDFRLPDPPITAPDRELDDDTKDEDPIVAEWDRFGELADRFGKALECDPLTGWSLVDACRKAGWGEPPGEVGEVGKGAGDRFYFFHHWLFDRLGRMASEQVAP